MQSYFHFQYPILSILSLQVYLLYDKYRKTGSLKSVTHPRKFRVGVVTVVRIIKFNKVMEKNIKMVLIPEKKVFGISAET